MHQEPGSENAIMLAMFGTSVEHALPGLLNIRAQMTARFPGTPVSMAFTSATVRRIWRQRANDPAYVRSHPEIPAVILSIRGPRAAIVDLQDAGYRAIIVQAVHMAPAREYEDLCDCVAGLNSGKAGKPGSRPSAALIVGRPALGSFGTLMSYIW
jgi:sirohydrochlorin cobaltochelatase